MNQTFTEASYHNSILLSQRIELKIYGINNDINNDKR
jgi:hypothetical protein